MLNSLQVIAVTALYLAGWQRGSLDGSLQSSGRSGQLELSLSAPKAEYAVGERVHVTMTLRNTGPGPAALRPSTLWLFDFAVYDDSGRQIDTWASGRPFPMALRLRLPFGRATSSPGRLYGILRFLARMGENLSCPVAMLWRDSFREAVISEGASAG